MPPLINLRKIAVSLALAVLCLGAAGSARADSYTINQTNFTPGSNFGTINVTLVGSSLQVSVQLAAGFVIHGAGIGFNVVNPDAGVSISMISNPVFSAGPTTSNFDGFGNFEFSLQSSQSTSQARTTNTNSVTFTVSRTGGFSNMNQLGAVSTGGGGGFFFALQIAPLDPTANTGFAASNVVNTPVPEPASMLLLGTGLIGVAGAARRRFKGRS